VHRNSGRTRCNMTAMEEFGDDEKTVLGPEGFNLLTFDKMRGNEG
jgi:hypothetical protein